MRRDRRALLDGGLTILRQNDVTRTGAANSVTLDTAALARRPGADLQWMSTVTRTAHAI